VLPDIEKYIRQMESQCGSYGELPKITIKYRTHGRRKVERPEDGRFSSEIRNRSYRPKSLHYRRNIMEEKGGRW
jgi:hypothetical protein